MLIYNGQITAGGGTIVLSMTRAEYEANKAILDSADVWVDLTDEPDQVATADQIAYSVDSVQKSMGYIGDIATKAVAKVEPTDTALYLHEAGEYFINKDGDACKVDLQIPVNGTIALGTNCHVLPKGVANDINSNLSANNAGTATYITTTSYTFPSDGYLTVIQDGGVLDSWVDAFIKGANNIDLARLFVRVHTAGELSDVVSVMVKKGMSVSLSFSSPATQPNATIQFVPLIN